MDFRTAGHSSSNCRMTAASWRCVINALNICGGCNQSFIPPNFRTKYVTYQTLRVGTASKCHPANMGSARCKKLRAAWHLTMKTIRHIIISPIRMVNTIFCPSGGHFTQPVMVFADPLSQIEHCRLCIHTHVYADTCTYQRSAMEIRTLRILPSKCVTCGRGVILADLSRCVCCLCNITDPCKLAFVEEETRMECFIFDCREVSTNTCLVLPPVMLRIHHVTC